MSGTSSKNVVTFIFLLFFFFLPGKHVLTLTEHGNNNLAAWQSNLDWTWMRRRRASISVFKKKPMVNIREYYEKDGEQLPGKKGISLAAEQWRALADGLPALQQGLEKVQ